MMVKKHFDYDPHMKYAQRTYNRVILPVESAQGECEFCDTSFKLPPDLDPRLGPRSHFFNILKMTGEMICYSCFIDGFNKWNIDNI